MIRTLILRGTTEPIFQAVLQITQKYQRDHGSPLYFGVTCHGNTVVVTADNRLCMSIQEETASVSEPVAWPWMGDAPSSCASEDA